MSTACTPCFVDTGTLRLSLSIICACGRTLNQSMQGHQESWRHRSPLHGWKEVGRIITRRAKMPPITCRWAVPRHITGNAVRVQAKVAAAAHLHMGATSRSHTFDSRGRWAALNASAGHCRLQLKEAGCRSVWTRSLTSWRELVEQYVGEEGQESGHHARRESNGGWGGRRRGGEWQLNKDIEALGDQRDMEGLLELAAGQMADMNGVNVATLLNRLGRAGKARAVVGDRRFHDLIELVHNRIKQPRFFQARHISNILNTLAKLGYRPGKAFIVEVLNEVRRRGLPAFIPQAVANIVNACAKVEYHPGIEFFGEVATDVASRGLHVFKPQEVATIINAFAKFVYQPGEQFLRDMVADVRSRGLAEFDPQAIANILNGLAKLGYHPGDGVLAEFVTEVRHRGYDHFEPKHLAVLLSAFVQLRHADGEALLRDILAAVERTGFAGHDQQGLCTLVWVLAAYGQLGTEHGLEHLRVMKPHMQQCIADMARSRRDVVGRRRRPWALNDPRALPSALAHAVYSLPVGEGDAVVVEAVAEELRGLIESLEGIGLRVSSEANESALQRRIAHALQARGYDVESEVLVAGTPLSIDMLLHPLDHHRHQLKPVAIDVDGPSHYFTNHPQMLRGDAMLKHLLLQRAVERGPLQAWVAIPHWDEDRSVTLVEDKLTQAGLDIGSYCRPT